MKPALLIIALGATVAFANTASAQTACEPVEQRSASETIQQLAERCGVSVDALLGANRAATVEELASRDALAVPQRAAGDDWLGSAREAVVDAGRRVNEAASAAGRSVSDYLRDQPDLNRDVLSFGEKIGVPGFEAGPSTGPRLDVVAGSSGMLDFTAAGLPGDKEVTLGWLDDGVLKPIKSVRTDERGRLTTSLARPDAVPAGTRVMFAVETTDKKLRLASDPVGSN